LREGAEARVGDAMARLNKDAREDDTSLDGPAKRDEIETTMALPIFDAAGARLDRAVHDARDLGRQRRRVGRVLALRQAGPRGPPPKLARLAAFPDVAVAYARAHPDEEVRGVSAGEIEAPK